MQGCIWQVVTVKEHFIKKEVEIMAKSTNQKRKTVEYGRYGYYFIAPFFIVFAIFQLWPLIYTIGLAFCENYTDTMFNVEMDLLLTDWRTSRQYC